MNKKLVILFLTISFLIISILPILNFSNFTKNYNFKVLFNSDNFESYINYFCYKILKISLDDRVIVGKNSFLFVGNYANSIIEKTQGIYKYDKNHLNIYLDDLKELQSFYEETGIKFLYVMVPNKSSIYNSKLPKYINYNPKLTDDIVNLANDKNINFLDLRPYLLKSNRDTYSFADTHWNFFGASIGYEVAIDYLNKKYFSDLKKVSYSIEKNIGKNKLIKEMDLLKLLKIKLLILDKLILEEKDFCTFNIDLETNQIIDNCKNINPMLNVVENKNIKYIKNLNSINRSNLLILGDSFLFHNSLLYNATFENIYASNYELLNGTKLSDFLKQNKIDIVIYQIAERGIYPNSNIVKKMSKIELLSSEQNISYSKEIFNIFKSNFYQNNHFEIENKILKIVDIDPILILNRTSAKSKYTILQYKIDSEIETVFQIFYKKNSRDPYSEENSKKFNIKAGNNRFLVLIPSEYINNKIRFDLVSNIGIYEIKKFSLYEVDNINELIKESKNCNISKI